LESRAKSLDISRKKSQQILTKGTYQCQKLLEKYKKPYMISQTETELFEKFIENAELNNIKYYKQF